MPLRGGWQGKYEPTPSGIYTGLSYRDYTVMSDTIVDIETQLPPIQKLKTAKGRVLLNGLGLGIVAQAALRNGANRPSNRWIEKSPDVIKLVEPYFQKQHHQPTTNN